MAYIKPDLQNKIWMLPKYKSPVYNSHHYNNKNLFSCWVFLIKTKIFYKPRPNSTGPQPLFFVSPPTFGSGYFSIINQRIGAVGSRGMRPGSGAARSRVWVLPRGNHPHSARMGWGPGRDRNSSSDTQGNEAKWIQTAAKCCQSATLRVLQTLSIL